MRENEGVALCAIRWSEIFPWLSIASGFRLALSLRLMTFGAAAALLTLLGWWVIAGIFSRDGTTNKSWTSEFGSQSAWQVIDNTVPNRPFAGWEQMGSHPEGARQGAGSGEQGAGSREPPKGYPAERQSGLKIYLLGPMIQTWAVLTRPVWQIVRPEGPSGSLTLRNFLSLLLSSLSSLAVWAYFGAAISRVAAVQLASGEQVGWGAGALGRNEVAGLLFSALAAHAGSCGGRATDPGAGASDENRFPRRLGRDHLAAGAHRGLRDDRPPGGRDLRMAADVGHDQRRGHRQLRCPEPHLRLRLPTAARYLFYVLVAALVGWLGWFVVENFAASVIWLATWAAGWGGGPRNSRPDRRLGRRFRAGPRRYLADRFLER